MAVRAYDESYLPGAQSNLGHAVDFGITTLGVAPGLMTLALQTAPSARQFAAGNPTFVAGMNGCELARRVLDEANVGYPEAEDAMYLDKSPEYWAGWALAYYQWLSCRSFTDILKAVPLEGIVDMYPVYHEMDVGHFADRMGEGMRAACPQTRLRERREEAGLSQAGLAEYSGVPLRQIQLFEQRRRDVNRAAAATLLKLARALSCSVEDLMEYEA